MRTEADTAEVKERVRAIVKGLREDAASVQEVIAEFDGKRRGATSSWATTCSPNAANPIISEVMSKDLEVQLASTIARHQAIGDEEIAQINAVAEADKREVSENVATQEERLREQLENVEQRAQEELETRIREDLDPLVDPVTTVTSMRRSCPSSGPKS